VYRPVGEGGRCDLIFDMGHKLMRIQCKWGVLDGAVIKVWTRTSRHTPNGYVLTTYGPDEIDAVAVYCQQIDKCYLLPISLVQGRMGIYLRIGPTKNGQSLRVQFAAQYELGAIAQLGERLHGMQEVAGSSPASST
jgi:hypothetical protein